MQVRNATMAAEQVASMVLDHRQTVREFDFDDVILINGGTWEDALQPLTRVSGSDEWQSQQSGSEVGSFSSSQCEIDLEQVQETGEVIDTAVAIGRTSVVVTKLKKKRVRRKHRRQHKDTGEQHRERPVISNPIPIADPNVQGVQRNLELEAAHQRLADDPDMRISTLQKAKEAVLKQLGKEFCRSNDRKEHVKGFFKTTCSVRKGRTLMGHESNTALVPLIFSRC
jgi:hypothetical protein